MRPPMVIFLLPGCYVVCGLTFGAVKGKAPVGIAARRARICIGANLKIGGTPSGEMLPCDDT